MSEEFKDPHLFAEWLSKQIGFDNDWQLDKDFLVRGNQFYSADTCVLLPNCLNKFLTKRQSARGAYLIGVIWKKKNQKFEASFTAQGKSVYIGLFCTELEAHLAYKVAKEAEAKRLAEFWKELIDPRAYNALINYEVLITD